MEGKAFRARGGRVHIDDAGIDVYSRRNGGLRLPWPVILDIEVDRSEKRHALRVRVANGTSLALPAPTGDPGHPGLFDAQAREIIEAYKERGAGLRVSASGEPRDEIPVDYRLAAIEQIGHYGEPSRLFEFARPGRITLVLVFLAALFGLGGSVHSYLRDLPVYDAYRAAPHCSAAAAAAASAAGGSEPSYCTVTDGAVQQIVASPEQGVYEMSIGTDGDLYAGPIQFGFWSTDPPALENLLPGDRVDYVAVDGGNVASITLHGVTYQAIDSPQVRHVSDSASLFASAFFALVFASLLVLKIARRRLLGLWALLPLMFTAAFIVNVAADGGQASTPFSSVGALLVLTGLVACATVAALAPLCWWFRRRARRLVSLPHPALP
jgi:hypothetical protein